MGTLKAPLNLEIGQRIGNFQVKKKLGEGACGVVYLCNLIEPGTNETKMTGAIKIEARMEHAEDEILKMEIHVLKRLQNSRHVIRLLGHGATPQLTYIVMSLLGKELGQLRKKLPGKKMNQNNILRIGMQAIKALEDVHEGAFLHRDVKPSNLAMGFKNPLVVYIFDFGMARAYLVDDGHGGKKLREPRKRTMFRGTVRYCSLNVHQHKEQGRHDDLISLLFTLVELHTGVLPWKLQTRKEATRIKKQTTEEQLCKACPAPFLPMAKKLNELKYVDKPPYSQFVQDFCTALGPAAKLMEPFAWAADAAKSDRSSRKKPLKNTSDKKAVLDKGGQAHDQGTLKDVLSEMTMDEGESHTVTNMDAEDTLQNIE